MVDVTNRGDYCKAQTATVGHNSNTMDRRAVVVVILVNRHHSSDTDSDTDALSSPTDRSM